MLFNSGWNGVLQFGLISLGVALIPGPSWLFVISSTLSFKRRGGFIAVAGNGCGILFHLVVVATGLSTILTNSSASLRILQCIGGIYLCYLGIATAISPPKLVESPSSRPIDSRSIFPKGILVNVLNPKVLLLMASLLPQFVAGPEEGTALRLGIVGSMHVLIASLVLSCVVLLAHRTSLWAQDGRASFLRYGRSVRRIVGVGLCAFGIRMLLG